MYSLNLSKNKRALIKSMAVVLLVLFLSGSLVQAQEEAAISSLRQMGQAFSEIAKKTSPAVVGIKANKVFTQKYYDSIDPFFNNPFFDDDVFEHFFGAPRGRQREPKERKYNRRAQGSGFIISKDGYILTNNHLVGEADTVKVKLSDESEFEAKVIGADPESDVALIKIESKEDLPFLELADSEQLQVGEWVIAIGNPFGLSHTVTAGIVSAKGRSGVGITTYEDFIQTDAAINPGNSGGPLLTLDGKAVGINTAIISRSGGNMGIGLAIPVNMAKNIYEQLVKEGKVVRGYLGIRPQNITKDIAESYGLDEVKGALVAEVVDDSAADKGGLKFEDIILEVNGRDVKDASDLMKKIAAFSPGTEIKLIVLRNGKKKPLKVTLDERPGAKEDKEYKEKEPATIEKLGLEITDLSKEMAKRFGYNDLTGVIVVRVTPGSVAEEKGIEAGMLIIRVNSKEIEGTKDFYREIQKVNAGEYLRLVVTDGRMRYIVAMKVPEDD